MTPDAAYALPESWYGSYYELAIEVSSAPDDAALAAAVQRLWTAPQLVGGPWRDRMATDAIAALPDVAPGGMESVYGMVRIPELGDVRCVSWILREEGGGADWVDLCIPSAALPWPFPQDVLDAALVPLATHVWAAAPFRLALIGEEVSGMWSAETITPDALTHGGVLLPEPLARRLGAGPAAAEVAPGLWWVTSSPPPRSPLPPPGAPGGGA